MTLQTSILSTITMSKNGEHKRNVAQQDNHK